jgi:hypothetical protein
MDFGALTGLGVVCFSIAVCCFGLLPTSRFILSFAVCLTRFLVTLTVKTLKKSSVKQATQPAPAKKEEPLVKIKNNREVVCSYSEQYKLPANPFA